MGDVLFLLGLGMLTWFFIWLLIRPHNGQDDFG